jgi:uncharacterized protein YkwD
LKSLSDLAILTVYNYDMRKYLLFVFIVSLALIAATPFPSSQRYKSDGSTPDELIDAVNSLRAANGLLPYQSNSILMGIAQNQANYMASIGTWTHTGPDGSLPYQRALAAGYPVAGDLTQGGWFSENVIVGIKMTAAEAVLKWQGDAPHLGTMLSPTLRDIGAGVAVDGDNYYFVIDCGLSSGGTPVAYTPPAYLPTGTTLPNTPNPDGSIIHIVKKGDSIYGIAFAYGIQPSEILALNGLTIDSDIYINQKIVVRRAYTPTATLPTSTPTHFPTITPWPTSTTTPTFTPVADVGSPSIPSQGLPLSTAGGAALLILLLALGVAALLSRSGKK